MTAANQAETAQPHHRVTERRPDDVAPFPWGPHIAAFEQGEWRTPIFRDMVAYDVRAAGIQPTLLDIGCGAGFDNFHEHQQSLADLAGDYIGVEPDTSVPAPACCTAFHATVLEDAPIAPQSVDVAFAVFVLEHVPDPEAFFAKVHEVLKSGGVFWGFTVDGRSAFAIGSRVMEATGVKDRYLDSVFGARDERHLNYPTTYKCNSPKALIALTEAFASCEVASLHHEKILDRVVPKPIRPAMHVLDRMAVKGQLPAANLAVRLVKGGA